MEEEEEGGGGRGVLDKGGGGHNEAEGGGEGHPETEGVLEGESRGQVREERGHLVSAVIDDQEIEEGEILEQASEDDQNIHEEKAFWFLPTDFD